MQDEDSDGSTSESGRVINVDSLEDTHDSSTEDGRGLLSNFSEFSNGGAASIFSETSNEGENEPGLDDEPHFVPISLMHHITRRSSAADSLNMEITIPPRTPLTSEKTLTLQFDNVESLRAATIPPVIHKLDLSYCRGIVDSDLLRFKEVTGLEVADLSGCTDITPFGLTKFVLAHTCVKKLILLDMKLGYALQSFRVVVYQRISFLAISSVSELDFPYLRHLELNEYSGEPFKKVDCPRLEKLNLKCTREVKDSKILFHLLQVTELSPKLSEINIFIPAEIYKSYAEELRVQLQVLPYITYNIIEYVDRHAKKKQIEERRAKAAALLVEITSAPPGSLGFDLLRALKEDQEGVLGFTDLTFTVKNNETVSAHKVIVQARCPALLADLSPLASVSKNNALRFLEFIYGDVVLTTDHLSVDDSVLTDLERLGHHYKLSRLVSICQLLEAVKDSCRETIAELSDKKEVQQYEVFPSTLGCDIAAAFYDLRYVDCSLRANPRSDIPHHTKKPRIHDDLARVKANRFVLAARCNFFKNLFEIGMRDSKLNEIPLNNVSSDAVRTLVEYLYSDEVKFDPESVCETYVDAGMRLLPRLQEQCITSIKANISHENAIFLATQSYLFDATAIEDICFAYFTANASELFLREEILGMEWEILKVFLSHTYNYLLEESNDETNTVQLQCSILRAVLSWAKKRCTPIGDGKTLDLSILRRKLDVLFKYMYTIRLSPVDFANCLIESEIFSKELVVTTFSGLGVVFDDELFSKKQTAPAQCSECGDWGYQRISGPCRSCYHTGIFCHWCNFTGEAKAIGPPCASCIKGEVVRLKFLFDKKLLEECIRIPIESSSFMKRKEALEAQFEMISNVM